MICSISVAPEWVVEPQDQTAAAGEDLTVVCSAYGYPTPKVTWYRKGNFVSEGCTWSSKIPILYVHVGKYYIVSSRIVSSAHSDTVCPLLIRPEPKFHIINRKTIFWIYIKMSGSACKIICIKIIWICIKKIQIFNSLTYFFQKPAAILKVPSQSITIITGGWIS